MTVEEALGQAESALTGIFEAPRLQSELLLMGVLGCSRVELFTHPERVLERSQNLRFLQWLEWRQLDYPLQYLRGEQEFYGRRFLLSPEVLIPRPETETLVELALDFLSNRPGGQRIVDVGTGSGCIAITLCCEISGSSGLATDLHWPALRVARRNRDLWDCSSRLGLVCGDALSFLGQSSDFDLIVSNPPYVGEWERGTVQPGVRDFEPHQALFAGADGMNVYRKLLRQAGSLLAPQGRLMLEMGSSQAERISSLAEESGWQVEQIREDLSALSRVISLKT